MIKPDTAKALERLGISEEIYNELFVEFLAMAREKAGLLEKAVAAGDMTETKKLSHSIKGSAANLGVDDIAEIARTMENASAKGVLTNEITEGLGNLARSLAMVPAAAGGRGRPAAQGESMEKTLGTIKDLPTLPAVLRQVSSLIETNETDLKKIADVITTDSALSLRILRLVNSAFYGLPNRVTSLQHAVVALGLRAVYNLMLGLTVVKMFKNGKSPHFDPEMLWRHSFGCALLSEKIAGLVKYTFPDECFIAGLLHDMGRLVFDQYLHDRFSEASRYSAERKCSLLKGEKEVIGFDHAEAGAWLAQRMIIPDSFVNVIQYHHKPSKLAVDGSQYRDIVRITSTSNKICILRKVGDSGESMVEDDQDMLNCKDLGVDEAELADEVKKEVDSTIARWSM
jgi:putative nucleotidyltransferase with HDIG domain